MSSSRDRNISFCRLTEKPCNNSSCYTYPTLPIREFHDMNGPINSAVDDREYAVPDVNFYSTFSHSPHLNLHQKYHPPAPPSSSYMCSPRLIRPVTRHCYPTLKPINPHCCIHQQYLTMQTRQSTKSSNSNIVTYCHPEEFPSIEASCGNCLMIKYPSIGDNQLITINEIHSDRLTLMEKIGDGLFGSLHVAELSSSNHEKQMVIVKSLKDATDEKQK